MIKRLFQNKRARRWVFVTLSVLLSAGIAVATVALLAGSLLAGSTDQWDLFNFVTGVDLRDSSGTLITDGKVYYDSEYTFYISFSEFAGTNTEGLFGQFEYTGSPGRLLYKLPSEIEIPQAVSAAPIRLFTDKTKIIGYYDVDTLGNVAVWFGEFDDKGATTPGKNFIDNYTNANFVLEIEALFKRSTNGGKITFGADAEITIQQPDEPPGDLIVDKTASTFSPELETIDYTITITAVNGPVNNIKLEDVMSVNRGSSSINFDWPVTQSDPNVFTAGCFQYKFGTGGWQTYPGATPWKAGGQSLLLDFTSNGTLLQPDHRNQIHHAPDRPARPPGTERQAG